MLDWARINELREDFDAEDFDEIVALFLREVDTMLGMLDPCSDALLQEQLHFLKGSASNLGFQAMHDVCARKPGDMGVDLSEIARVFHTSREVFLKALQTERPNACSV